MKWRDVASIDDNRPRVFPVYRIIDTDCWLVKTKRARVGEEYVFMNGPRNGPAMFAVGPLIPGTITLSDGGGRYKVGNIERWEFVEYRVRHGGELVGVHLERKRVFQATPKVKSKGVKK